MHKQLFLSHSWGVDSATHEKVLLIATQLRRAGWTVWLDATDLLGGNIDATMFLENDTSGMQAFLVA